MNGLFINLLLAILWAIITGDLSSQSLLVGFVLGYAILFFTRRIVGVPNYGHKTLQIIGLLAFFVWELIKSNLRVAYEVLTPGIQMRPGIVMVPLDARSDLEITLLANLITLTPGTLSLDVANDRRVLFVHAMFVNDPDQVRQSIKDGFERRVIEVLR